ncbi:CCR4-NOT transcription complex subunit 3-like isoform X3 [Montipora foliosa]
MNPYPCERTFTLLPGQLMWNCSSLRGYRRFSCLPKTVSLASDPLGFCHVKKEGESKSGTISASLKIVASSHQEENSPTDNQLVHINDLLYNGFYCFEMISERSLDDVVCGVCGICPEICLGDGNEKNCCSNSQQPSTSNSFSSLKSIAAQAVAMAGLSNPVPAPTDYSSGSRALLESSSSQTTDENKVVQETNTAHLQPLLGVAPLGPVPLNKERCYQLAMLEAAYHHLPLPADSEKVRPFLPRNPYPTPAHHHQHPPQHVDSIEFFQRLSTETLFFIFYYQE